MAQCTIKESTLNIFLEIRTLFAIRLSIFKEQNYNFYNFFLELNNDLYGIITNKYFIKYQMRIFIIVCLHTFIIFYY